MPSNVVPIRAALYAERIESRFIARGAASSRPDDDTAEWRRVARKVARNLGRPVQTVLGRDGIAHAVLTDFPRDDPERAAHEAAMRTAMRAAGE